MRKHSEPDRSIVVPFPPPRERRAVSVDAPSGPLGTVLLFTGVRYERWGAAEAAPQRRPSETLPLTQAEG